MIEQGLKNPGTYLNAFEKHWYRSGDPIPTVTMRRFEALGKKCWYRNFDPIPMLSGAIPTVLKTLG